MTSTSDPSAPCVVNCPHCGKPVPWTDTSSWKPFCSKRCRLIDLGDWLTERHAIPDDADEPVVRNSDEN